MLEQLGQEVSIGHAPEIRRRARSRQKTDRREGQSQHVGDPILFWRWSTAPSENAARQIVMTMVKLKTSHNLPIRTNRPIPEDGAKERWWDNFAALALRL